MELYGKITIVPDAQIQMQIETGVKGESQWPAKRVLSGLDDEIAAVIIPFYAVLFQDDRAVGIDVGKDAVDHFPAGIDLDGRTQPAKARFPFPEDLFISADYQRIANPAYNSARGPVNFFGLRAHIEM